MQRQFWNVSLVLCAALVAGCFALTDYDDVQDSKEETFTLPFVQNLEGFDILFVVDPSPSTDDLLDGVGEMAPSMIGSLDYAVVNAQGFAPRLHIGVITPNLGTGEHPIPNCSADGDRGELQTVTGSGCPELTGNYIVVVDNQVQNMIGVTDVATAVQCLIDGQMERETGCGFEQPLAAVAKAVDPQQTPLNDGFFRTNAGLAVVLMTDQDDCSASTEGLFDPDDQSLGPVTRFRCFEWGVTCDEEARTPGSKNACRPRTSTEGGLLYEPGQLAEMIFAHKAQSSVVFATVAQPTDPVVVALDSSSEPFVQSSCGGDGVPGVRLAAFLAQFEDFGLHDSVCEPQLPDLLFRISERMAFQAVSRCMPKIPADMFQDTPGLQAQCTAWDVLYLGEIYEERSEDILSCVETQDAHPCWRILADSVCSNGYKMEVLRDTEPAAGSIVEATCRVLLD
jgi:hypothetical protein